MTHQYNAKGMRPIATPESRQTVRYRRRIHEQPQKATAWLMRWEREFKSRWVRTDEGYFPVDEVKAMGEDP